MWFKVLCYGYRGAQSSCEAKSGNPFGPYWNKFGIDFDFDEVHGPLSFNIFGDEKAQWMSRFPSQKYPVLAFTGSVYVPLIGYELNALLNN